MDAEVTDSVEDPDNPGQSSSEVADPGYWLDPPAGTGSVMVMEVRNNSAPLDVALIAANGVVQGILGNVVYEWLKKMVFKRKGAYPTVGHGLTESDRREVAHLAVCARRAELGMSVPKGDPVDFSDFSADGQFGFIYSIEYSDFNARVVLPRDEIKRDLIHVTIYESRELK